MTIKSKDELKKLGIVIDLTGPEGNAIYLLGQAQRWLKQLERDPKPVLDEMKSSDYENLIAVFEREFGEFVTLYK